MTPVEVHPEDQYAVVGPGLSLAGLEAHLREHHPGLHYRAPDLEIGVTDWVLSGGLGQLGAPPVRADVLGLSYRSHGSLVEAGGRVVKNVSGYDLVRLVVGSDPALRGAVRLESVTLRLRPRPAVTSLELAFSEAELDLAWPELRRLGAAYGLAHRPAGPAGHWWVRGVWWSPAPLWGEPAADPVRAGSLLRDAAGLFPRAARTEGDLERLVRAAL